MKEYNKLSKDEKKQIREEFKKTKKGQEILPRLNRMRFDAFACYAFAIIEALLTFINNDKKIHYVFSILVLIAGIFFTVAEYKLRRINYNKLCSQKTIKKGEKIVLTRN